MILENVLAITSIILCVSVLVTIQELRLMNSRITILENNKTPRKTNGFKSRK